jgi:hypothetical protein
MADPVPARDAALPEDMLLAAQDAKSIVADHHCGPGDQARLCGCPRCESTRERLTFIAPGTAIHHEEPDEQALGDAARRHRLRRPGASANCRILLQPFAGPG